MRPTTSSAVKGATGIPPEVDVAYLNGRELGTLTGDNNVGKMNQFNVPICDVAASP